MSVCTKFFQLFLLVKKEILKLYSIGAVMTRENFQILRNVILAQAAQMMNAKNIIKHVGVSMTLLVLFDYSECSSDQF